MANKAREQFVKDMQMAGRAASTQKTYLYSVQRFFAASWISAEDALEEDVRQYLLSLREQDAAKETFRVRRHALGFPFENSPGRRALADRPKPLASFLFIGPCSPSAPVSAFSPTRSFSR